MMNQLQTATERIMHEYVIGIERTGLICGLTEG